MSIAPGGLRLLVSAPPVLVPAPAFPVSLELCSSCPCPCSATPSPGWLVSIPISPSSAGVATPPSAAAFTAALYIACLSSNLLSCSSCCCCSSASSSRASLSSCSVRTTCAFKSSSSVWRAVSASSEEVGVGMSGIGEEGILGDNAGGSEVVGISEPLLIGGDKTGAS